MTREEAIKILEFEKQGMFKSLETKEALDIAIKALFVPESTDLISREEALAKVRLNYTNHQTVSAHAIKDILSTIPSVVPEREKETDLISREAVIDLLNQFGYYDKEMERDLSAIPSAVPEREKGEWITDNIDEGYVECPFCHSLTNCECGKYDDLNFCFNCGAELRGGKE